MLALEAQNIKKYYSDRLIIEFDELKVYTGDKIGIVGQNGSGKTTLMNILSGEIEPDEGFVRRFCQASYIRQFSCEKTEAEPRSLKEFGLSGKLDQNVFSGGEKTRTKIANALSKDNLLMFADEPTASLDYKGIELLGQKLSRMETFLLISHDSDLLDSLCNRIIEIKDGKIKLYNGNYSFYKEQCEIEYQYAEGEYNKYVSERAKLEDAVRDRKGKSRSIRKAPRRMGNSEARLHTRSANEKQEKINNAVNSLKTRLEKLEVKEKPKELPKIKLDFYLTNPPENKIVISAEGLTFKYGSNKILDNVNFKIYNKMKTALWGGNGTGKTTLLNLINSNTCENIYVVPKTKVGYFYQGFENLENNKSVLENVMTDSVQTQVTARTILARLLISGDDVYKNIGVLSGGERIKVCFAKLFVSNANILLLDEPTNYLDIMSIDALGNVLLDYEGTVIFVSHDSAFVDKVADRLLILENQKIIEFDGSLQDYKKSKQRTQRSNEREMERTLLQMRIADTVARLTKPCADKEALEAEYQRLISQLK